MIVDSLISDSLMDAEFDDPGQRFLALATAARESLRKKLSGTSEELAPLSAKDWRRQYIWEVDAIADALGVEGLVSAQNAESSPENMAAFDASLTRVLTKIKVGRVSPSKADTVALSPVTRLHISDALEKLRSIVNASNLSADYKASLHRKLDAVDAELEKRRSGLSPFWSLAGAFMLLHGPTAIKDTVGFLADLPGAANTVQDLIGAVQAEKAAELREDERAYGGPPHLQHEPTKLLTDRTDLT